MKQTRNIAISHQASNPGTPCILRICIFFASFYLTSLTLEINFLLTNLKINCLFVAVGVDVNIFGIMIAVCVTDLAFSAHQPITTLTSTSTRWPLSQDRRLNAGRMSR